MKSSTSMILIGAPLLLLAACAELPSGPSIMALPGSNKSFDQFRVDDSECRQYAQMQVGGKDASQAGTDAGVRTAAIGAAVGAAAGALVGGHQGAGSGAATGLVIGGLIGTDVAQSSANGVQRRYDNAYIQCMYAKGEQVPASGVMARSHTQAPENYAPPSSNYYPPPASGSPPPPPSGNPPPPPPDAVR